MNNRLERQLSGVIILHGFTANLESVRTLFEPLSRLDLKLAAPLLRGHGESSPEHLCGVTWKEWLADAEKALEELAGSDGKAVVLGHSMGALLAMQLAVRHPEKVDSIILATVPLRLTSALGPGRPLHFLASFISCFVDRWEMEARFADPANAIVPKQYEWAPTKSILSMFELLDETARIMGQIRRPALILHCRKESIVLPESADIVFRSLATPPENKSIVWLDKSDHQIFCDCERHVAVDAAVGFITRRMKFS